MSRRVSAPKRHIIPDAKYGDQLVAKFVNSLMLAGKRSTAEKCLYGAFEIIEERFKGEPLDVFKKALDAVKPPRRGEEPSSWRRHVSGSRRGPLGTPQRARDALASSVLARTWREVHGRASRSRAHGSLTRPRKRSKKAGRHTQDGRRQQGVCALSLVGFFWRLGRSTETPRTRSSS